MASLTSFASIRFGYLVLPKAFPTQIVDLYWAFFILISLHKQACAAASNEKSLLRFSEEALYRGPERIRTAVGAFAELCLATRPPDPNLECENNAKNLIIKEFYSYSYLNDICVIKESICRQLAHQNSLLTTAELFTT